MKVGSGGNLGLSREYPILESIWAYVVFMVELSFKYRPEENRAHLFAAQYMSILILNHMPRNNSPFNVESVEMVFISIY